MFAHGGLFKTKGVAQNFLAAAINTPVSVGEVAAEGGAWESQSSAYLVHQTGGQTLDDFLNTHVFADTDLLTVDPDPAEVAGFDAFMQRYTPPYLSNEQPSNTLRRVPNPSLRTCVIRPPRGRPRGRTGLASDLRLRRNVSHLMKWSRAGAQLVVDYVDPLASRVGCRVDGH